MIHHGDCLEVMAGMEPESVDAIVTDPPYLLQFMGKAWDSPTKMSGHATPHAGTVGFYQAIGKGGRHDGGHDNWRPSQMQQWHEAWAREAYRVAKPSAYLLAFGGTRTVHRLTSAIEDAGWIIRDMLVWCFASGFPKSRASLKPAYEPIILARKPGPLRMLAIDECRLSVGGPTTTMDAWESDGSLCGSCAEDAASPERLGTSATRASTTPKPAEQQPNDSGTLGAISRAAIGCSDGTTEAPTATSLSTAESGKTPTDRSLTGSLSTISTATSSTTGQRTCISCGVPITPSTIASAGGRWPANLVLSDPIFDGGWDGVVGGGETATHSTGRKAPSDYPDKGVIGWRTSTTEPYDGDSGTYSRFFLIPKADRTDREPVLGGLAKSHGPTLGISNVDDWTNGSGNPGKPPQARANVHPTVKPVDLMRHLVRLVTPTGGTVLDPFLGSGTTAIAAEMEGFEWIGIEKEAEYVAIAEARLNGTQRGLGLPA